MPTPDRVAKRPGGVSAGVGGHDHSHGGPGGHTHEVMDGPGSYPLREALRARDDWDQRAFTVGVGGPVGSGKTALMLALCKMLRQEHSVCAITNDIFTREDWEFLCRNEALPEERMRAIETGGCPHAAIREDYSANMDAVRELTRWRRQSGGQLSRELADYIIYVIDGGPGITQSDLLVSNKTDLAEAVGADLAVMQRDASRMRQGGPTLFTQAKHGVGVDQVAKMVLDSATQLGAPLRRRSC
ncbi:hypothetical protein HPB48_010073 [Haemaphysalis longicornis]|uniref:CobW/HypB/UreG nucleotide-binding domain-containing protein n=1 Tax=Haemaphysalis longicornis TaxID=44386 RepID=A0A9J6GMP3_HAELO|nr:hypothetical protein HPB48_010073 [Haemaphysalis longicornis]